MKKTLRILSLAMLLVLLTISFAGCHKKIDENLPVDMQTCERGTRMNFDTVKMKSFSCIPKILTTDSTKMVISINIVGYNGIDYYNCGFDILFSCVVFYDGMTEEKIDQVIEISLPYEGTLLLETEIPLRSQAHEIYNNTYEIVNISGEAIKKY